LAGGWKQRLALGCAILHRPPILFLDEPTSGVDPESRRRFWDLIHAMAGEGVTVLVSTHYMDEAEYCNRIALIDAGRLVALGHPSELKAAALGGALLLVECDRLGPTLDALSRFTGVLDAAPFGNSVHVLLDSGLRPDDLVVALRHEGLGINRMAPIAPSLEDVFVRLVGRNRQAAAA
jgi:ABC-2 type transport system ATP-binding protein